RGPSGLARLSAAPVGDHVAALGLRLCDQVAHLLARLGDDLLDGVSRSQAAHDERLGQRAQHRAGGRENDRSSHRSAHTQQNSSAPSFEHRTSSLARPGRSRLASNESGPIYVSSATIKKRKSAVPTLLRRGAVHGLPHVVFMLQRRKRFVKSRVKPLVVLDLRMTSLYFPASTLTRLAKDVVLALRQS